MEEIIDEEFFLNELLSDSEKENKTKNSFENIGNIKEQFGFKQVGSIANYIEPINSSNPIEIVLEKFLENEDLQAIPIEEDDQIVGLIERRSVSSLLSKKIGLFSNKKIINYVKTIPVTFFARDYIEKILAQVSSAAYANDLQFFPVMYNNSSFYGLASLEDFMNRVAEVREKDLEKACFIQQNCLPKSNYKEYNSWPFKLGIWNKMANAVGGDFYVSEKLSDSLYLTASFDVSGKNVAAALLTMTIASFFSMIELDSSNEKYKSPAGVTIALDDFLQKIVPVGNFITGALCYVDLKKGIVEIQNCGHTNVYVFMPKEGSKSVKIFSLEPGLPPFGMGAVKDSLKSVYRFPIVKGSHINLYSDGFTDMQSENGIRFEDARAKQFFMRLFSKETEQFEKSVKSAVEEWIENAMIPDDITVMDIRL